MPTAVLVVAFSLALAGPTVEERLERAQAAYDNLDYEVAAQELAVALADPSMNEAQRLRANMMAGVANRVIGHDVEARMHFLYVLKHKPDATLPASTPPKILSFFELVREEAGKPDAIGVQTQAGELRDPLRTKPLTGKAAFSIASEPPGANVYVGSRKLGTTPITVDDVAPGVGRVTLERDDGQLVDFEVPLYDSEQTVVRVSYEETPADGGAVFAHYGWATGKLAACTVLGVMGTACLGIAIPAILNFNTSNLGSWAINVSCISLLCGLPGVVFTGTGLGLGTWAVFDFFDPPEGASLGHIAVQSPREQAPTRFTVTEREGQVMPH